MSAPAPAPLVPRPPAPGTPLYRRFGDSRSGNLAVTALLLQVMHPVVDAGVTQHSAFVEQGWRRLYGTLVSISTWTYGGEDGARLEAERLRRLHVPMTGSLPDGTRYTALAPGPWTWVYATLLHSAVEAQRVFGGDIPVDELEILYRQARELGLVLHIREQDLPDTWAGFTRWFDETCAGLDATEASAQVLAFLRDVPPPRPLRWFPRPVWRLAMWLPTRLALVVAAATLPPAVRERLGLPWRRVDRAVFSGYQLLVRALHVFLPGPLRILGARIVGAWGARRLRRQQ